MYRINELKKVTTHRSIIAKHTIVLIWIYIVIYLTIYSGTRGKHTTSTIVSHTTLYYIDFNVTVSLNDAPLSC